jgi:hypothetical protein
MTVEPYPLSTSANLSPRDVEEGSARDLAPTISGAHAMGEARHADPLLKAAQAIVRVVEGPGCLRWVAGPWRLKDRNEWCAFYSAVKDADRAALAPQSEPLTVPEAPEHADRFTPGPWEADMLSEVSAEIRPVDDLTVIARVTRIDTAANARLIAAAPDLYEALSIVFPFLTGIIEEQPGNQAVAMLRNSVRAALAKAGSPS